jgi:hypothetical protein
VAPYRGDILLAATDDTTTAEIGTDADQERLARLDGLVQFQVRN